MKRLMIAVVAAVLVSAAYAGSALGRTTLRFAVSQTASAGKAIPYTYSVSRQSRKDRLVLQQQMGTRRVWRTIQTLRRVRSGASSIAGQQLGVYAFRLAILHRGRVALSKGVRIEVFGSIPFTALFGAGGVYTTPSATFPYAFDSYAPGDIPSTDTATLFTVIRNSCRSVHVDFIPGTDDGSEVVANQSGTATIVQQTMNPVSATVAPQTLGSLDARLVPGQSWSLNVTQDTFEGSRLLTWYINGSMSCYSKNIGTSS